MATVWCLAAFLGVGCYRGKPSQKTEQNFQHSEILAAIGFFEEEIKLTRQLPRNCDDLEDSCNRFLGTTLGTSREPAARKVFEIVRKLQLLLGSQRGNREQVEGLLNEMKAAVEEAK